MSYQITWLPLEHLVEAAWNANRVDDTTLPKIRKSIERFGIVENLVVRPIGARGPETATLNPAEPTYEVLSGNHRLRLYREMQLETAPCQIVTLDDGRARILAEALNHVRGKNDPDAYRELIRQAVAMTSQDEVLEHLNETSATLKKLLEEQAAADPPLHWEGRFELVIECADEHQQQELYHELTARGLTCRVLTM